MLGFAILLTHLWGRWTDWLPHAEQQAWIIPSAWLPLPPESARVVVLALEDIVLALLCGLLLVFLSQWMTPRWEATRKLAAEMASALGPLRWRDAFFLAVLSGVAEEALFRATLQPLASLWVGPLWGLILISLLFGLIHTGPKAYFLLWTVFAILFGFLAGSLFWWRGGLFLPAMLHITVNFFNLKYLADHGKQWS